jgi:hypothetical protein
LTGKQSLWQNKAYGFPGPPHFPTLPQHTTHTWHSSGALTVHFPSLPPTTQVVKYPGRPPEGAASRFNEPRYEGARGKNQILGVCALPLNVRRSTCERFRCQELRRSVPSIGYGCPRAASIALTRRLQKGGDPAAGSPTATLLRLRPSHRARLRPLCPKLTLGFRHGLRALPTSMA